VRERRGANARCTLNSTETAREFNLANGYVIDGPPESGTHLCRACGPCRGDTTKPASEVRGCLGRFDIVSCTAHRPSKRRLLTGFVAATIDGHFFDPGTVTYAPRGCLTEPLSRAVHYRRAERFITGKMRPSTTNGLPR
jgi:hypothetical protein